MGITDALKNAHDQNEQTTTLYSLSAGITPVCANGTPIL